MAWHPSGRLFDQVDFSGQGELSYNEFLAATLGATQGLPDEEKVRTVFERLDTDGDGTCMATSRDTERMS